MVQEDCFIPTLNKMGYMTRFLDVVQNNFIAYASQEPGGVSLDLGAAFGVATLPLLKKHQKVVSCDLDPGHLKAIRQAAPPHSYQNLMLKPGNFPATVRFRKHRFKAVLCAMVLHFVPPHEIISWVGQLVRILQPGGRIFVTVSSPYQGALTKFIPIYEERLAHGNPWPGHIADIEEFVPHRSPQLPKENTVFCPTSLEKVFREGGFEVLECFGFTREHMPDDLRYGGQEYTGLVATVS